MERFEYTTITEQIIDNPNLQKISKIGMCRIWTKVAMEHIQSTNIDLIVEAREVDLEPYLQHTFLRITCTGGKPFLIDGTGSANFPPYFGYEDDAPPHLLNSRPDIINNFFLQS